MKFADIASGESVFIAANTLVYHFAPDPVLGPPSTDLLVRVRSGDIQGFTSTHIVSEMAHRLMAIEAMKVFGWPYAGIARRLRKHPTKVQQLKAFRQAIQDVSRYGLDVLLVAQDRLDVAAAISQQHGLLSNDALIVAVMQQHGLVNIASGDTDFDRVPGITRYSPV